MKNYKILSYTRLKNSYYGNPRYQFELQDDNGVFFTAKTKSDYSYVYGIFNHGYEAITCQLEKTKAGNYMIRRIKE